MSRFTVILGYTGAGKTAYLEYLAVKDLIEGKRIMHITLDERVFNVNQRIICMLGIAGKTKLLPDFNTTMHILNEIRETHIDIEDSEYFQKGMQIILASPGHITILQPSLESSIQRVQAEFEIGNHDSIYLDYFDLLNKHPDAKSDNYLQVRADNAHRLMRAYLKSNTSFYTATQARRGGDIIKSPLTVVDDSLSRACSHMYRVSKDNDNFSVHQIKSKDGKP